MIKKILNGLYIIGILLLFFMEIVYIYDLLNGKNIKNVDWYGLILILIAFYSTIYMIYKLVKTINCLENIKSIIHNNMENDIKIQSINFKLQDVSDIIK